MEKKEELDLTLPFVESDIDVMKRFFCNRVASSDEERKVAKEGFREILKKTFSSTGNFTDALKAILNPEDIKKLVQDESSKLSPAIVEELSQDFQIRRIPRKCKSANSAPNVEPQEVKREPSLDLGVQEFSDESDVETAVTPQKRKAPTARKSTCQTSIVHIEDRTEENLSPTEDQSTPKKRKPTARKSATKPPVVKSERSKRNSNLKVLSPQTLNQRTVTNFYKEKKQRKKPGNAKELNNPDIFTPEVIIDSEPESENLLANLPPDDDDPNDQPDSQETTISEKDDLVHDPSFNPDDTLASEDSFRDIPSTSIRTRRQREQNPSDDDDDEIFENTLQQNQFQPGVSGDENKENNNVLTLSDNEEDDDDQPVTSTPKPKRPGKPSLMAHLKNMVEVQTDQPNLNEEVILENFEFSRALSGGKNGFAEKTCPCKLESEQLFKHMYVFNLRGQPGQTVDICPKCMEIMIKTGEEDR